MCQEMCKNARVLYVSGEESLKQIKIRAARLHISSPELYILTETDMEQIINETELLEPDILIVDSIQTVYKRDLTAAPGGTTQIKEFRRGIRRSVPLSACGEKPLRLNQ